MSSAILQPLQLINNLKSIASRPFRNRMRAWEQDPYRIYYRESLDGAGRLFAPYFVDFLRREHPRGIDTLFEWCSGPGFIGFSLLRAGICRNLVLADINPRAIDCVRKTVRLNGLEGAVRYYVSENLRHVPAHERFDAVVANPPFYCCLNPQHPLYEQFKDDLRPNDPDWKAHDDFYRTIGAHLNPAATLYIMEVEPEQTVYITPGYSEAWDVRPRPPIEDFRRMIDAGGLTYVRTADFIKQDGYSGQLVISRAGILTSG